jgi:hypothetical protein
VRTFWVSNCSSSADQRILDISLQSDCPLEVDFDVSQLAGSSSQSRDLEFDTAAKRRDQGIITTTSTNSNHSGVLHGLLQQDLIQSKNQRDRLLGIVNEKADKPANVTDARASSKAATEALTNLTCSLPITVDQSECMDGYSNNDHDNSRDRSLIVSSASAAAANTGSTEKVPKAHSAERQHSSKGKTDSTASNFADVRYKSNSSRDVDKHLVQSNLNADDDYTYSHGYSALSRPLTVTKYGPGPNTNGSRATESSSVIKSNRRPSEDGFRADDVWGSSRSNTMLSYVVSLSEVMVGSGYRCGYDDDVDMAERERERERVDSGVDSICGGYVSDDRCFVGTAQYKWSSAWSSRSSRGSRGSYWDQLSSQPSRREGALTNQKATKRSAVTQGQTQSFLYGDRDRDREGYDW